MGFLDSFKRALGFDAVDDNDMEIEGIDATVRPLNQRSLPPQPEPERATPATPATPDSDRVPTPEPDNRPDPTVIFERVVEVFNESLPGFLQKSVDPARQRRVLYDSLDNSIKEYYEHLDRNVERRLQARFETDRRKLQAQIEDLRVKAQKEEEGNSNAKNLQLSAERQKRALSERVHDLEKQLATLEAENEQYILENKSMANKLRMAAMAGDSSDNENIELLARLQQECAELKKSAGELREENKRLRDSLEQARVKDELGVAMVNDLNSKAHEAKNEAADARTEANEARSEAENARSEAESAKAELEKTRQELAALIARHAKAQEDLKVVKEIQQEVLKLEENQRVTEARIRSQKDELMEKEEQIKQLQADILSKNTSMKMQEKTIRHLEDQTDSLRKNIETTLYEKSQVESALRSEIDRLKSIKGNVAELEIESQIAVVAIPDTPVDESVPDMPEFVVARQEKTETPKPRRGRPPKQKAADDFPGESDAPSREGSAEANDLELLESTDWLIATPPEDSKTKRQRKSKPTTDDSFGYKEPERQEPPDNPAQMLLW